MYPVFLQGQFCDVVDMARIKPECPPLLDKKIMKKWKVTMDFGDQEVHVQKHNHTAPFIKDSPFLDLLNLGPPEKFNRAKVPEVFWLDSKSSGTPTATLKEAQAYDDYKKHGVTLTTFGKLPAQPPVFPQRTSGGGYGTKDGYDDPPAKTWSTKRVLIAEPEDSRTRTRTLADGSTFQTEADILWE